MANDDLELMLSGMLNEIDQEKKKQPTFVKMQRPPASGGGGLDPGSLLQMLLKLFGGGDQPQGTDANQQAYRYFFPENQEPQDPEVGI